MISVLIPAYNRSCYTLVYDVAQQLEQLSQEYEVIVAEDGSRDQVAIISNHRIIELPHCRHICRRQNVGRSAIRNYLAAEAQGDWLLFIDSDARVTAADFIQKYLQAMAGGPDVICGGIIHPSVCPNSYVTLRWRYEHEYETRCGGISEHFRSSCFLIRRTVFDSVKFDERYTTYGLEDVQFGKDLRQHGYKVCSIVNPIMDDDLEPNPRFLAKTEESLRTLRTFADDLQDEVSLLKYIADCRRRHVLWLLNLLYLCFRPLIRRNLLGPNPDLRAFAFYKLGYYINLKN